MRFWLAALTAVLVAFSTAGCGGGSSGAATDHAGSTGSSGASASDASTTASVLASEVSSLSPTATREVDALLAGIPQTGVFLGSPSAPVTLQYFVDVGCPAVREITMGPLASIIKRWVRTGRLRLEFRSIEEGTEGASVFVPQQVAALAAGAQGKLWNYLEYLYRATEKLGSNYADTCHPPFEDFPQSVARLVPGLRLSQWSQARRSPRLASEVTASLRAASRAGLGVQYGHPLRYRPYYPDPGYLIGRTGGGVAMTLSHFAKVNPAYDEIPQELSDVEVQGS